MTTITRDGEAVFEHLPAGPYTGLWNQVYHRPPLPDYTHVGLDIGNAYQEYATGLHGVRVPFTNDGSFGNGLCIDTGIGEWRYRLFAHNSRVLVPLGGTVEPDTIAAVSGATGDADGAHIHVQVARDTRFVHSLAETRNPLDLLATEAELELKDEVKRLSDIVAGNGMMCVPWEDVAGEPSVLGCFPAGTAPTPRNHPDPNATAVLLTQEAALQYSQLRGFSLGYGVFLARNDLANHLKGHTA